MTGCVHFIGGEKGGVGKSMVARLLAQYLIDQDQRLVGFDSDPSHRTFTRFYQSFTQPVDTADFVSLDQVVEAAEAQPDAHIVVDLAAQTAQHFRRWAQETDVYAIFQDLDFTVYMWHVMDDSADATDLLAEQLAFFEEVAVARENMQLVVVKNLGRGKSFTAPKQQKVLEQAKTAGAYIFEMPELHADLAQKVDFNGTSFWAAANNREVMSLTERHRVKVWQQGLYNSLQQLFASQSLQKNHAVDDRLAVKQGQTIASVSNRKISNAIESNSVNKTLEPSM